VYDSGGKLTRNERSPKPPAFNEAFNEAGIEAGIEADRVSRLVSGGASERSFATAEAKRAKRVKSARREWGMESGDGETERRRDGETEK